MANYYISGVWKDDQGRITDVNLHLGVGEGFARPRKTHKTQVIALIKAGNNVNTITWGYPDWELGASVAFEKVGYEEYLRTDPNASVKDNLDNSLPMDVLV